MFQKVQVRNFLSARDSSARLTEQAPLRTASADSGADSGLPTVSVDPERRYQSIVGFGGAFTEAAAVTWLALDAARRQELLRACFDRDAGHGYTLCRVHMGSCDFALGNYSHVETPGDLALASFSIERDRRALLPFIQAAQRVAGRPIKLLASPWSPPAWMKSNGQMNGGGTLRPECRDAWARCFVRFIEAYAAEGVPIWGVTVQNEPQATQRWDSCLYSAEAERDFVRDYLGPTLAAAGLGEVKIIIWDHNRDLMLARANLVYADPEAARYVWGTGFHWYGEDCFDQVQRVHDAWPDKQLLFTEGCQEGGPHHGSWELGERYARSMINDLNRWTVGWIDWNLLLDQHGGPNHVGNFCSAPIVTDAASGALVLQSSFFYIGHFTRFVRPGAQRVSCVTDRQDLEAASFVNPDGSIAVIAMNRSEQPLRFALCIAGARTVAELPPRSIATYLA
ncbi:MAG: glycoside hydrolase family 30 protein [Steroidobacteraceae bacterium]